MTKATYPDQKGLFVQAGSGLKNRVIITTLYYILCLLYNGRMHLVLTHEQADFDALAALFAAALVDDSLPILPRRINRNGRAFIALYGADFPFIDPRDLPEEAVESVTLVDTQSLITLKGMGRNTRVRVYDHHPRRNMPKYPKNKVPPHEWEVITFELGATTTYFVEVLKDRGEELRPIQATLMLLGIYEDTGSLTYSHTTARDIHAAGWLLEQGAELRSVTDFLNPPLSAEQRLVYDRLLANMETLNVHGHRILIASTQVQNQTEEISTLAHKLRDLFDPDALFVIVETPEGIRFVARSSTDMIDVSEITAHFGGGGHDRAAAALIKPHNDEKRTLEDVRRELVDILPGLVRPSLTVSGLMSKRPRLMEPGTLVQEAARLMSRYGYEGFPVIDNGKVVGLLTRRAVDRAINHRLNLSASSLMEAGCVYVFPDDSIQKLQVVMTESGWGQVPVLDPASKAVIGIVTRTDLLKTLARLHPHPEIYRSLATRLKKSIPAERLALIQAVAGLAASEHLPVYIVGGFVRDVLLSHPSADFDIVVEGDAIFLGNKLTAHYGGKLTTHSRFGTARWNLSGSVYASDELPSYLDLISARQEFYDHPSALPTVEHGSIKLDLHRRDFTINTLALRLDGRHYGELHDYYGGQSDLQKRIIRVLHSLSFIDDPTRMLRAVRYEIRYGFKIEPRTLQLMEEARPLITRLTAERLRHELDLIMDEARAVLMVARLNELGLLGVIADEMVWNNEIKHRLSLVIGKPISEEWLDGMGTSIHSPVRALAYCMWFMAMSPGQIDSLQERLCFTNGMYKAIRSAGYLFSHLPALAGGKPSAWVMCLDGIPLLAIYAVYLLTSEEALLMYAVRWRKVHPKNNGHSIIARGYRPGPYFENILGALRSAWLDGEIQSFEDEDRLLGELLLSISNESNSSIK